MADSRCFRNPLVRRAYGPQTDSEGPPSASAIQKAREQRVFADDEQGVYRSMWKVLVILLAWNAIPWIVIGVIAGPVVPGRWATIAVVGLLLFLPICVLIRGFSGRIRRV